MKLTAIIMDTFREALARKTIIGFFALSTLLLIIALVFFLTGKDFLLQQQQQLAQGFKTVNTMDEIVKGIEAVIARALYAPAIILSIFATASIIPNMLEKGSIDLLLSKPISRAEIIFGKIAGATIIVFLNVSYYISGMWLIISVTMGVWDPGLLTSIFLITYAYIVLFAIAVIIGVTARSSALAILTVYFLFIILIPILTSREMVLFTFIENKVAQGVITTLYYILPKTDDLANISSGIIMRQPVDLMPIWSSGVCALVLFAGSIYIFQKKDF